MTQSKFIIFALSALASISAAQAEPVKFSALVAQKEALRLDFADASKHFFLLVHREGKADGQGPLSQASVDEERTTSFPASAASRAVIFSSRPRVETRPT